ncbi:MAG: NAD(P)/FAD-dependent oxidoreductase, partial [Hyphomicrobiaceae bacterium]|nr:NAD(P)/FAD-dependent oxidoreductase [Hyphomicrobiaceae bacterium]
PQPETEKYLNFVADKLDLRRDIQFSSKVTAARYLEELHAWRVTLEDGSEFSCRFLVTAVGPLSAATLPRFEGLDDFKGQAWHTAQWPKEPVSFDGKRVAVVGTGATGVQVIQEVAKTAGQLTVFQRRPNWCTPLLNRKIDTEEMDKIREGYAELFEHCRNTTACFMHTTDPRATFELSKEEREKFWEKQYYEMPGFAMWQGNFRDILIDREANRLVSEYVAQQIRKRVHDPKTADLLTPKDHGFGTRRVPQETGYYEVYNQPNVELVSMLETPVERVTERGIKTTEREYEFDIIIYATGFDAITGAIDRIDIRGTGGQSLKEKWQRDLSTFVGIMVDGFPNLLMDLGPHTALGNVPRSIEYNVEWVRDLLAFMKKNDLTYCEPKPEAVADWIEFVNAKAEGLLSNEIDSWMTGVNLNVEGKQTRRVSRYSGSAPEYRKWCDDVAAGGYKELILD